MKLLAVCALGVAGALALQVGGTSMVPAPAGAGDKRGVDLPEGDPLLRAVQTRFGRPDRVTGSGRMFIHYDLQNGDTLTLVVSGDKVIGVEHEKKK
jgi:hypothetical protein